MITGDIYQAEVAAFFASLALAGTLDTMPFEIPQSAILRIGAEQNFPVDDTTLWHRSGAMTFIQAKSSLDMARLANVAGDMARQTLHGRGGGSALNVDDRLLLVVGDGASVAIRRSLREILGRVRGHPTYESPATAVQGQTSLGVVLDQFSHAVAAALETQGAPSDETAVRTVLQHVAVLPLSSDELRFRGGRLLADVLHDSAQAGEAFKKLADALWRAGAGRISYDLHGLENVLERGGIALRRKPGVHERRAVEAPVRLVGVKSIYLELRAHLLGDPPLVSIEGVGGIGKTSLVKLVTSDLRAERLCAGVAWYALRQREFGEDQDEASEEPLSVVERVISEIAAQLGFREILSSPSRDRAPELARALARERYFVVIDNVEVAAEIHAVLPLLQIATQAAPSKFIIGSRVAVVPYAPARRVQVEQLSLDDSVQLLREEAHAKDVPRLAAAGESELGRIVDVVGGNPLALKLSVGLLRYISIHEAIDQLVRRKTGADPLYRWIYWRLWELMSEHARQLLVTMPRFSVRGADAERLAAASGLSDGELVAAIRQLVDFSLLNVSGTVSIPVYSVHRLTATFADSVRTESPSADERERLARDQARTTLANVSHTLKRLREES